MSEPAVQTDLWVQRFVREVLPRIVQAVQPERVILFGSRIQGTARPESDLDVVVVADRFREMPIWERMPWLLWLADFDKHVDFFCYTPEEFQRVQRVSSVIEEAVRDGWHITSQDWPYLDAFLTQADVNPHRKIGPIGETA